MAAGGGGAVKEVKAKAELDSAIGAGSPVILHFWASWCDASKHMDQVFSHLSTDFPLAHFFRVEAEEQSEISEAYSVSAVPYFVFFKGGKAVDTLEGADPSSLANKVAKVAGSIIPGEPAAPASLGMAAGPAVLESVEAFAKETHASENGSQSHSGTSDGLKKRLQELVNSHPVMLFMKGNPETPQCGLSQKVVDILKKEKVEFGSFDILSDNEVRKGLKKFANWPTFPQLYCKGELIGGCDIAIAMHKSGELRDVFRDHGVQILDNKVLTESDVGKGGTVDPSGLSAATTSRLQTLIDSGPVMLFMKGKPDEPQCGFSRKVVDILRQEKIKFVSFDILTDDEVRQGLKIISNWSSYPQLYIKGELIGGSDVLLEMQQSGELKKLLAEKGVPFGETLEDRLKQLINSSPVMLFMKDSMPPRREIPRDIHEKQGAPPPPPPQDSVTRMLEGMAQLLERAQNAPRPQVDIYERFRRLDPKDFTGTTDPFMAEGWIRSLEVHFRFLNMRDADRVRCATYLLKDDASLWWEGVERGVNLDTLMWAEFKELFYGRYFTVDVRSKLKREFMSLRQVDMSVAEYIRKFDRGCHFVPLIANDAAEKLRHFMDGLKPTIRRDVMMMEPADYVAATTRAFRAEHALKDIEVDMQRKRTQSQSFSQSNKRQFSGPQRVQGHQKPQVSQRFQNQQKPSQTTAPKMGDRPLCKECGKSHVGKCMQGTYRCFYCKEEGHKVTECPKKNQAGMGRAYVMHAEEAEPDATLITGNSDNLDDETGVFED